MKRSLFSFFFVAALVALSAFLWLRPRQVDLPADATDLTLARERVAAYAAKDLRTRAREALAPLVNRPDAVVEDLVRAAAIEVSDNDAAEAESYLARAEKIAPDTAAIHYLRGQLAREAGDSESARVSLLAARALAPRDLPTAVLLGAIEDDLEHTAEAEKLFREVVSVGFENGQQWYYAAATRLANLLANAGRDAEAEPLRAEIRALEAREVRAPSALQFLLGELGRVEPPRPRGSVVETLAPPAFQRVELVRQDLAGLEQMKLVDEGFACFGPGGVRVLHWPLPRGLVPEVTRAPASLLVPLDADNDGDQDLLVAHDTTFSLFANDGREHAPATAEFPPLSSPPREVAAVDWDHEGDLDLVLVGAFGVRIWRRDGTSAIRGEGNRAVFTDATAGSGLPVDAAFEWCIPEDFDGDNDVDFLCGGTGRPYLADSLRGGKFRRIPDAFPLDVPARPVVADFDGDARADLWIPGEPSTFVPRDGKARASVPAKLAPSSTITSGDFDLDGALDLAFVGADGTAHFVLAVGLPAERALDPLLPAGTTLLARDVNGDRRLDLVFQGGDGLALLSNEGPTGRGVPISLAGLRDNTRGVGAILELRAGSIYRRVYWRGDETLIGIGTHTDFDVLRTTWPNGASTTELDLALDARNEDGSSFFHRMPQPSAQIGSCPFLYTWNGSTYTFVSDVLGITPLGLPIDAETLVPPDHDEYVLVSSEQLKPRDGTFELQFTEELREVTYLDHAKLVVVDHPDGTEVFPNERFTFPPFPKAHVHSTKDALSPRKATASNGADVTDELARIDDRYAVPFTRQPPQFAGLAQPWFVELAFDPARTASARKLRLVMTGWFFWSDASANMASARTPDVRFIPPILQVPDGQGGWRDAGPPIGFPAGKTKTMVIDVSSILSKDDPRVRVFTSLQLFWDALRLAVDDDDAPLEQREIACGSARLWRRGFSAPLDPALAPGTATHDGTPERFDWNVLAPEPRWNQHPGRYTRYGECRELLDTVDDRFVILGAGDALTLRFDAHDLAAPAPGMRRDFLVYLDGWAKDRDPNTIQALEVEPLPFHAMSGYPYRADEHFPDDELHERWRAEWNTRPGWNWIRPVSPARAGE